MSKKQDEPKTFLQLIEGLDQELREEIANRASDYTKTVRHIVIDPNDIKLLEGRVLTIVDSVVSPDTEPLRNKAIKDSICGHFTTYRKTIDRNLDESADYTDEIFGTKVIRISIT